MGSRVSGAEQRTITLGTRGSKLALAQAALVRDALLRAHGSLTARIETISTTGDAVQDRPLSAIGGNGVFVRAIEAALLDGRIDLAVHSAKDLPAALSPGTVVAAYLPRADARDVLISRDRLTLEDLPEGARIGTSSPRRALQLRSLRPDLMLLDIRGNVDTRLRKLREGQYDAIVLAAAGLERLGLLGEVTEWLDPRVTLPAVGQGALAVQARTDDEATLALAGAINDEVTYITVTAERSFLAGVGGSCALPVASHARLADGRLMIAGMVGSPSSALVRGEREGPAGDPASLGRALAADLLERGGRKMVEESLRQESQA